MNCKQVEHLFADYLTGECNKEQQQKMETHLRECAQCREAIKMWRELGALPQQQPNPTLSARFYSALDAYKQGMEHTPPKKSWPEKVQEWFHGLRFPQPVIQFAMVILCLAIGYYAGKSSSPGSELHSEVSHLQNQLGQMQQVVSLSLLKQSSSSERLKGISFSYGVHNPDIDLLNALIKTLNDDPNVNVRLAAVDALYLFSDRDDIRDQLIQALQNQSSPLVQISLIDLLVEIREQKSLNALRTLISDGNINSAVKQRAEWGIKQLI
jgi:hypothetical protein